MSVCHRLDTVLFSYRYREQCLVRDIAAKVGLEKRSHQTHLCLARLWTNVMKNFVKMSRTALLVALNVLFVTYASVAVNRLVSGKVGMSVTQVRFRLNYRNPSNYSNLKHFLFLGD